MKYYLFFVFLILFGGCSQKKQSINYIEVSIPIEETIEKNVTKDKAYGGWMRMLEVAKYMILHGQTIGVQGLIYHKRKLYNRKGKRYTRKKIIGVHKPKSKNIKQIKYHSYTILDSEYKLKQLKNTMTYVFFPRNLIGQNQNTQKYKKYAKTLELIQELKKISDTNTSDSLVDKYENKFILFKNNLSDNKKVTVETYNYKLAHKLLDFFREKLPPSFFDKDGPFFITASENIFEKKEDFNFIHLDLSTFKQSAINQVINSYKDRLVEKGDKDIEILEEWYYEILSALTNFDEHLHFVQIYFLKND